MTTGIGRGKMFADDRDGSEFSTSFKKMKDSFGNFGVSGNDSRSHNDNFEKRDSTAFTARDDFQSRNESSRGRNRSENEGGRGGQYEGGGFSRGGRNFDQSSFGGRGQRNDFEHRSGFSNRKGNFSGGLDRTTNDDQGESRNGEFGSRGGGGFNRESGGFGAVRGVGGFDDHNNGDRRGSRSGGFNDSDNNDNSNRRGGRGGGFGFSGGRGGNFSSGRFSSFDQNESGDRNNFRSNNGGDFSNSGRGREFSRGGGGGSSVGRDDAFSDGVHSGGFFSGRGGSFSGTHAGGFSNRVEDGSGKFSESGFNRNDDKNAFETKNGSGFRGETKEFGSRSDDFGRSKSQNFNSNYNGRGFNGERSSSDFKSGSDFSSGRQRDNIDSGRFFGGSDRNFSRFNEQNDDGFGSRQFDNSKFGDPERKRAATHVPEDRPLSEMYAEDEENARFEMSDLDMKVTVTGVPSNQSELRLDDWANAGFSDILLRNIVEKAKYKNPRLIQSAVVPLIQNGWDMFGHAETGSGKTAAFLLPIISYVMKSQPPENSFCAPIALIVAPTRELVSQLYNQARKFVEGTGVSVAKAYGQYRVIDNFLEIERGCNLLFATMGRIKDFISNEKVKLHNIKFFVLDEADRMLSTDCFESDVMDLVNHPGFPPISSRQTLLFSATFEQNVQELAKKILKDQHAFVSNGKMTSANPHVKQYFIQVDSNRKLDELKKLLEQEKQRDGDVQRTLVFVQQKKTADAVALFLCGKDIPCSSVNGDRDQKQREDALKDFRHGDIKVLVATDVCARGIDVKGLEHVINYDLPNDAITYIHRIGRTGRLHDGKSTSFIDTMTSSDRNLAPELVRVVEEVHQVVPQFLRDLSDGMGGLSGTRAGGGFATSINEYGNSAFAKTGFSSGGGFSRNAKGSENGGGFASGGGFSRGGGGFASGVGGFAGGGEFGRGGRGISRGFSNNGMQEGSSGSNVDRQNLNEDWGS